MGWSRRLVTAAGGMFIGLVAQPQALKAQDTEAPPTQPVPLGEAFDEQAPPHLKRPSHAPAGALQLFVPVQISLSDGEVGQPVFAAPNLSYGATEKLTLRLLHSEAYRAPDSVAGVCFTGDDGGCPNVYNNVSADAVYALVDGETFTLTGSGGLSVPQTRPFSLGVMFGGAAEWSLSETFAFQFEPSVLVALNHHANGNPHRFGATARALAQATPTTVLFAVAGLFGPFEGFAKEHSGPVAAGAYRSIGPDLDVGLQFTFTNVYGADATLSDRQLTVLTAVHL